MDLGITHLSVCAVPTGYAVSDVTGGAASNVVGVVSGVAISVGLFAAW